MVHELVAKGIYVFILRIIGAGLMFGMTVLLARVLGKSEYGLFMLSLTIVTIASVIARLGLDNVLVKHVSALYMERRHNELRGYYYKSIMIVTAVCLLLTMIFYLGVDVITKDVFDKEGLISPLSILIFMLMPLSLTFLVSETLRGIGKSKDYVVIQTILVPALVVVSIFMLERLYSTNLETAVIVYLISSCIVFAYSLVRLNMLIHRGGVTYPDTKLLFREGLPMLMASASGLLMYWTDIIVVGIFEDSEDVGLYSVASRVSLLMTLLLYAANAIAAPKFSQLYRSGRRQEMQVITQKITKGMGVISLVCSVFMIVFSENILSLFGAEYTEGSVLLIILIIGQLVNVAAGPVAYLLNMTNNEKIVMKVMMLTSLMNLVLNIILVREFGVVGAAISTAVSTVIWNVLLILKVKSKMGYWVYGT